MSKTTVSDDIHTSASRMILRHGELEYSDLCENWRSIEAKAQGTVATAGIFIGGVFALLSATATMPCWAVTAIVIVILALVAAVLASMRALLISDCECLERTEVVLRSADKLKQGSTDEEARQQIQVFAGELATSMANTNKKVGEANGKKAAWVLRAQVCVATAVVLTAILIIAGIYLGWYQAIP